MQYEIKDRWTGKRRFACEIDDEFKEKSESIKLGAAVLAATKEKASLSGAYLRDADLSGAYLRDADLSGANLRDADLSGAYLRDADLSGANLSGADLSGADLSGAYLRGAYLRDADVGGKKLIGRRPIIQVGPIGSESRHFIAYLTDSGLMLKAGCFFGTRDEFIAKLAATHGDNDHAKEYCAALAFIDAHAKIWTPT